MIQLDFFESSESEAAPAVNPANATIPQSIAELIRYTAEIQVLTAEFEKGRAIILHSELPLRYLKSHRDYLSRVDAPPVISKDVLKLLAQIEDAVIDHASYLLAPGKAPLAISRESVPETLHPTEEGALTWSPLDVWNHLKSTLTPAMAVGAQNREAADLLIKGFHLDRKEVDLTGAWVVLSLWARIDDFYKKFNGQNRYSYHVQGDFANTARALELWQENRERSRGDSPQLAATMVRLSNSWQDGFTPGVRTEVMPGISIIPRIERIDFRLSPAIADELQAFIGMHRSPKEAYHD